LHQIVDDVGGLDERVRRDGDCGVNLPLSRAQRRSNCIDWPEQRELIVARGHKAASTPEFNGFSVYGIHD